MLEKVIFVANAILFSGYGIVQTEDVLKCLTKRSEKIRISCPKGHVIYQPVILGGVSQSQTCLQSSSDCVGITKEIKRQTNRCYWKKRCVISFCKVGKLTSCQGNGAMVPGNITYLIIKPVHCVPKEIITNVCSKRGKDFDYTMGIVRSHSWYPRRRPKTESCSFEIQIQENSTLVLETVTEDQSIPQGIVLQNVLKSGQTLEALNTMGTVMFHSNTSKAVRIHANFLWRRREYKGFMLPFKSYNSASLDSILNWPRGSRSVLKELGWILDVRAVIEQCATRNEGHVRLLCEDDKVIYSPSVTMSAYTKRDSKCIFGRKYPCGGLSPRLLVERNLCYWKNSCDITWAKSNQIIISKERKCIGYSASTIGFSGHRCVHRDKVIDLCTDIATPLNTSWGIIRSHSVYPWYFESTFADCKRQLIIGRKQAMTLIVQDMNLDPDGRDKFSVEHVKKVSRRTILDAKTGMEGTHVTVKGGKLVIRFKPFKESKTGRGFVLVFRRFGLTRTSYKPSNAQEKMMQVPISALLNDASTEITEYKLSNRRLCSKRGKLRKKGRACNKRVWTDYFTRLE